jgi:hypothetical protein
MARVEERPRCTESILQERRRRRSLAFMLIRSGLVKSRALLASGIPSHGWDGFALMQKMLRHWGRFELMNVWSTVVDHFRPTTRL